MNDFDTIRFGAGDGTAVAIGSGVALLAAAADHPAVATVVAAFRDGLPLEELIERLSSLGLRSLPPFALARRDADAIHVLQRGAVGVRVIADDGNVTVFERSLAASWREEVVPTATELHLSLGADQTSTHWCTRGVVPAGSVAWVASTTPDRLAESSAAAAAQPLSAPSFVAPAAPEPEPEPAAASDAASAEPQDLVEEPATAAAVETPDTEMPEPPAAAEAPTSDEPVDADPSLTVVEPAAEVPPPPVAPASAGADEADDLDFRNLLDHTVYHRAEDAAVRPAPGGALLTPPTAEPASAPLDPRADATRTWAEPPVPGGPSAAADDDPDHDGHTVARPRGGKATVPVPTTDTSGRVQAVRCPSGHHNPPAATTCRVCAAPITDRTQVLLDRPTLGVLRFSTGEVVTLDGPVVVGRTPTIATIDGATPTRVAIDNSELSRNHAVIQIDEWYVHVADQGSTNGTKVMSPGRPPQVGRPQEKIQIAPGAVVDLGGVVTFRFDAE